MCCKCPGGSDLHATTILLLKILASYEWEDKLVLVLVAFAMSYGEFWLTAQLQTLNPHAKSVALLKQLSDIPEHNDALKPRFDALNNIMIAVPDVTNWIVELTELKEYITLETPPMAIAITHIPIDVYWTIRSIVACASEIMGFIGMGINSVSSTTETWELSSLTHRVTSIHEHLPKLLAQCHQHSDEKKHVEAYHMVIRLFESIHIDNMKILRAILVYNDETPLVDPVTKKRVSVEVLRRKIVVLFISDLDVSLDELMILEQIYNDPHHGKLLDRQYQVVWLPVIDRSKEWTDAMEELFVHLANAMPWYSLYHHSLLDPAVIRFIKEKWNFVKKPLLVVLDAQGRVVCPNALHMMWIWGSLAFPFTSLREETLWKDEAWSLEFLVDEIDPSLVQWIREGRFICIYGGDDIEWIRKFTFALKRVSQEARIPIEMVYVGKSYPKERVRKIIATIADEKLSESWHDLTMIWFFWTRLESMWYSKMQHGRTNENDPIMQEVMTMLTFDSSDQGWALISKGSLEMVKAHGNKIIDGLVQFDTWKANIERDGFIPALTNVLDPSRADEHVSRLILPGKVGQIVTNEVCCECKRPMEIYIIYRCTHDQ